MTTDDGPPTTKKKKRKKRKRPGRERRAAKVAQTCAAALRDKGYVTSIDVLLGLGWLTREREMDWRRGRVPYLERVVVANLGKISKAMHELRSWATQAKLTPSETAYVQKRGRRPLQFSKNGDERIERWYRTHWVSPRLRKEKLERERQRSHDVDDAELEDLFGMLLDELILLSEEDGPSFEDGSILLSEPEDIPEDPRRDDELE